MIWARTEGTDKKPGRRIPLDADPEDPTQPLYVDGGNQRIIGRTSTGTAIIRYVARGAGTVRTHFITCPNARKHRKVRR